MYSMITIKNKASIAKMKRAGQLLSEVFDAIVAQIKPGVSTLALDSWVAEQLYTKTCFKM